ncbi:hypothetical protein SAMN02745136_05171 [Anaerocolumna jejuensis DSM 15929]|uniref:DnaJ domain-containing protein n=1 Tax=Anaerocolumna jejuensis DSM 15929 TaxID=1121322 RepID=A0A1M7BL30_9FIRM|nr:hypothetical protein [Anaerocolumna jejuensis]SHL55627.1 hypothetical protein SAMN02745136_05171 [Anaerocolumna jejuensis DSM 15929]
MESNTKEGSIKANKLLEGLKVFIANVLIFTIIDLLMFRLIHVKHSFLTSMVYSLIAYFVTVAYKDTVMESKKINNFSFYFWGLILPFVMGYGIYQLVWNDETMSQYINMRGLIDTVFYEGKVKGILAEFLLNSSAVSFERLLVFAALIITDVKRKRSPREENNAEEGGKASYEDTKKKESVGEEKTAGEATENGETVTEFFKGVKNIDNLKKRYRDLLKIYHPDNNAGDTEVTVKIKEEFELLEKQFLGK